MRKVFSKVGQSQRERNHGLTKDQVYHIFQAIVLPAAISKEKEAKEKGVELPVSASKMAENMLNAILIKYSQYTHEERLAFVRMAKSKYKALLDEV